MKHIFRSFEKPADALSFRALRISLASPEKVRSWSLGEAKKPERDGFSCAKISGSVRVRA